MSIFFVKCYGLSKATYINFQNNFNPKPNDSILVAGIGKSGTTALYSRIKNTLGDINSSFEPSIYRYTGNERLVKSIVGLIAADIRYDLFALGCFGNFGKRVFIVRDPRDGFISSILWMAGNCMYKSEECQNNFLSYLKQKEESPGLISFASLEGVLLESINRKKRKGQPVNKLQVMTDCGDRYSHFLIKYEDYILNNIAQLEDYLGFELMGSEDLKENSHVFREGKSGGWRTWFTPQDVDHFRQRFSSFMSKFGYDDDWELSAEPCIKSSVSSDYIQALWQRNKSLKLLRKF